MKRLWFPAALLLLVSGFLYWKIQTPRIILTGAFISDRPRIDDILQFKNNYGKKPYLVTVFIDWENFPEPEMIGSVYGQDCALIITWEPWNGSQKQGIDYEGLLNGKYDRYIGDFAARLKEINKPVYLRFAHEMNGNWYPWAGQKIGAEKYIRIWRYVKNKMDEAGARNVRWVFSVNAEDVPNEDSNHFSKYYPGNDYVDIFGIDGYNWGSSRPESKWKSFYEIFSSAYKTACRFPKPIFVTEFGSSSAGGDKALWIGQAMASMRHMSRLRGFVLFNADKETDWHLNPVSASGQAFRKGLQSSAFQDSSRFLP